jgi:hypothetical protein
MKKSGKRKPAGRPVTYTHWDELMASASEPLPQETLVVEMQVCEDASGLLMDAIRGLALAGQRHKREGKPIRLDGPGIQAVRTVLANYGELLDMLPARTMIRCHRLTEKRIHAILDGRKQPHDVEVV